MGNILSYFLSYFLPQQTPASLEQAVEDTQDETKTLDVFKKPLDCVAEELGVIYEAKPDKVEKKLVFKEMAENVPKSDKDFEVDDVIKIVTGLPGSGQNEPLEVETPGINDHFVKDVDENVSTEVELIDNIPDSDMELVEESINEAVNLAAAEHLKCSTSEPLLVAHSHQPDKQSTPQPIDSPAPGPDPNCDPETVIHGTVQKGVHGEEPSAPKEAIQKPVSVEVNYSANETNIEDNKSTTDESFKSKDSENDNSVKNEEENKGPVIDIVISVNNVNKVDVQQSAHNELLKVEATAIIDHSANNLDDSILTGVEMVGSIQECDMELVDESLSETVNLPASEPAPLVFVCSSGHNKEFTPELIESSTPGHDDPTQNPETVIYVSEQKSLHEEDPSTPKQAFPKPVSVDVDFSANETNIEANKSTADENVADENVKSVKNEEKNNGSSVDNVNEVDIQKSVHYGPLKVEATAIIDHSINNLEENMLTDVKMIGSIQDRDIELVEESFSETVTLPTSEPLFIESSTPGPDCPDPTHEPGTEIYGTNGTVQNGVQKGAQKGVHEEEPSAKKEASPKLVYVEVNCSANTPNIEINKSETAVPYKSKDVEDDNSVNNDEENKVSLVDIVSSVNAIDTEIVQEISNELVDLPILETLKTSLPEHFVVTPSPEPSIKSTPEAIETPPLYPEPRNEPITYCKQELPNTSTSEPAPCITSTNIANPDPIMPQTDPPSTSEPLKDPTPEIIGGTTFEPSKSTLEPSKESNKTNISKIQEASVTRAEGWWVAKKSAWEPFYVIKGRMIDEE